MLTVAAVGFPESLVDAAAAVSAMTEAAFVRLVVHCLAALAAPIQIMASFALAEHGTAGKRALQRSMAGVVVPAHCTGSRDHGAPMPATGHHCNGPVTVRGALAFEMSVSTQHVAAALELATDLKWNVQSGSPAYTTLAALMQTAQIAATPVKHVSRPTLWWTTAPASSLANETNACWHSSCAPAASNQAPRRPALKRSRPSESKSHTHSTNSNKDDTRSTKLCRFKNYKSHGSVPKSSVVEIAVGSVALMSGRGNVSVPSVALVAVCGNGSVTGCVECQDCDFGQQ